MSYQAAGSYPAPSDDEVVEFFRTVQPETDEEAMKWFRGITKKPAFTDYANGFDEGYLAGKAAGFDAGYEHAKLEQQIADVIAQVQAIIASLKRT